MASTVIFNQTTKQLWLAAGCVAGALLWIGTQYPSINGGFFGHRRLDISFHESKISERDVFPTFDTTQLQYMSSPCRPESDGYFGSTSGTPLELQYGFEMETEDEENVDFLLEEVQENIVDVVLSSSFPNLCGYRRRQERTRNLGMRGLSSRESQLKAKPRTTGFKFGMDLNERSDICIPTVDPTNLCGVYKNSIAIYGRHLSEIGEQLLSEVKEALKGEEQRLSKDGLVRLTTLDSLTMQTGNYKSQPTGIHALSFAAKAAIVIVIVALLAGAATFAVYIYLERKAIQQERPHRIKKTSSNRTLGCEEESQVSEKVGLRDGTAVVLEGGRPVVIEFDKGNVKRQRDAIEEERSECGSTIVSRSVESTSAKYVPRSLRRFGVSEESKEPEGLHHALDVNIRSDSVRPADRMVRSMASLSEYTDETAQTHDKVRKGEFT